MVAVTCTQIVKSFGATQVLKGVDIHVPDGAFAVLVGPSGCGKSTLLRLLAGLEEVTSGQIRFGERDVTSLEPRARDIAMVFQSYALYPHLSVRDNLAFGLKLRKTDPATIRQRVDEVATMLGLTPKLDSLPRDLSGGQRQRVAMGRAIVRRPQLFLFDEPLSNLDAALRAQVRVDIRKQHEQLGATSIYVTHDQVEAMTLADLMFVLNKGQVEQFGTPRQVYDAPCSRFVAGFLGSPAMNFLPAVTERGDRSASARLADGSTVDLDLHTFPALTPGQPITVGVRPHDLSLETGDHPTASALSLRAGLVELLGPELQIHAELAGTPVTLCLETASGVRKGDALRLQPRALHVFDAATGASLRA
ncbi:MAG: sn-glycerol-3-phosphate ABC transporter ATP-binding protein UgpC [Nannocystis sp.]|nr:sn-glycerol-3-phosphate ABC transporter ATP-binding protein UgpC [Nannocystis sp.]MBA3546727.1 sn-glycerol-3-phosphate ABC transporter ATP-binding protein UgpC [Nannocystis sp.]